MAGLDTELYHVFSVADDPTTAEKLEGASDRLAVETVSDPNLAVECLSRGDGDGLVTTHDAETDGLALIADVAAADRSVPTVVFAEPAEGLTERALAAGATEYVPAVGPDRYERLAHRLVSLVDTDRTLSELRKTAARFEALTENANYTVLTIDQGSTVRYASPAVEQVLGYEPSELLGQPLTRIMPDRFHDAHFEGIDQYLSGGERQLDWEWIELPGLHKNGDEVPLGISFGERHGGDGRLFTAVIRDITEQTERQERLDRLASAIEGSIDGMAVLGPDGTYQYVNDAHARIYGYDDASELMGEPWQLCYDDAEANRIESGALPAMYENGQWRGEATGRRADGSTFPQEISLTELDDGGIICVVRDITERVERRQQLLEERDFTESVLNTLQDVFYVLDEEGRFQRWNDRLAEVTGYTDAELDGMLATNLVPDEDMEMIAEAMMTVYQEGTTETRRSALVTKSGDRIPHEFNGTQLTDATGEVIGLTGIARDITDKQIREQRLSVLSRVLRHNVRNRMTVVQGTASYLRDTLTDEELQRHAERITDAAQDLADLSTHARQAESILREDQQQRERIDLVTAVHNALDDVDTDRAATLDTDLPESAPMFATSGVSTAIAELVENAIRHCDDVTVRITVSIAADTVSVSVADDGPGIPDHERAVLATGEETQLEHGTGIGLWLVNWVVTAAGGDVQFRENDPDGSVVELSFPSA